MNPFAEDSFVNGMEVILSKVDYNMNMLLKVLEKNTKEDKPVIHYTYDCALCYLTYKGIKDNEELEYAVENLKERINKNILKIKECE